MKIHCQRCNPDTIFEIPDFSSEAKESLQKQHRLSPLLAIKELIALHNMSHKDAKFIVHHITKEANCCNRCGTTLDAQEYTSCPKCGALNLNWK